MPKAKSILSILLIMLCLLGLRAFVPEFAGQRVDGTNNTQFSPKDMVQTGQDTGIKNNTSVNRSTYNDKNFRENTKTYHVVNIIDGDTIKIMFHGKRESVRLIGINTPEIKNEPKDTAVYGRKATEAATKLLREKQVHLTFDSSERDKYGRLLAYVYTEEGTFVNAELVRQGYARVMTVPPNVKYAALFTALEKNARKNYQGLWGLTKFRLENPPS